MHEIEYISPIEYTPQLPRRAREPADSLPRFPNTAALLLPTVEAAAEPRAAGRLALWRPPCEQFPPSFEAVTPFATVRSIPR